MEKNQNHSTDLSSAVLLEIYQDYQKQKRKQRFYTKIYYAILALIIALSVGWTFSFKKNPAPVKKEPFVAVVSLKGTIGSEEDIALEKYGHFLEDVFKDESIVGVVLSIDSPGGSAYESQILYDKIMELKTKHPEKKVITSIGQVGASGGYFLSLTGDNIYAHSQSIVGSIGVIQTLFDVSALLEKVSIKTTVIKSQPLKAAGNPFEPLSEEAKSYFEKEMNYVYKNFTNLVQLRRGERLKTAQYDDLFSGLAWNGHSALERGLVDYCDLSLEEAVKQEYGDYPFHYVQPKKPPFNMMNFLEQLADRSGVSSELYGLTGLVKRRSGYYYLYQ